MRKYIVCMIVVVILGVTGCGDSDVGDRLIQFVNKDLEEAGNLESEANDLYVEIMGNDEKSDEDLKDALKNTIVPYYEKMIKDVSDIDLGEYTELEKAKSLIFRYWSKKLDAFYKMEDAAEIEDNESMIDKAKDLFDEADKLYEQYDAELDRLGKKYGVTISEKEKKKTVKLEGKK